MKKFYAFLAACLLSMSAAWAQTKIPYTVFNANTGTLTYYYGSNWKTSGGEEYESNKDRFVGYAQNVKKAVIDASMKDAPFKKLNRMFYGGPGNELSNLEQIVGLGYLDTENVTDMTEMFYGCESLKSLDLSKLNTKNVESMNGMFELCSSLVTLNLISFETLNVRDMSYMFDGCSSLKAVNLVSFNTQDVNDMNSMFYNCKNLTILNLASFDMQSVTSVSGMFGGCKKLKTIYCNDDWNTIGMDADETFEECYSLVGGNGTRFDPDHTYIDYACPDKPGEPGYFTMRQPSEVDDRETIDKCEFEGYYGALTFYYLMEWTENQNNIILGSMQPVPSNAPYRIKSGQLLKLNQKTDEIEPVPYGALLYPGWYSYQIEVIIEGENVANYRFLKEDEGHVSSTMDGTKWLTETAEVFDAYCSVVITSPDFLIEESDTPVDTRTVISECAFEGLDVSSLYAGLEWTSAAADAIYNNFQKADPYAPYYLGTEFGLFKNPASVESQVNVGDILEEGLYQITLRIRLDGDYGTQYRFPKDMEADMDITVDGTSWTVDNVTVGDNYSFAVIISPAFQVGQPAAPTEPEIYAVFDNTAKTMTLYYDMKRLDRKGVLDWTNPSKETEETRNAAVETVILDASMKDARPESTEFWFDRFRSLTAFRHLDYLNTEEVMYMPYMFNNCEALEKLDLSTFDTQKVEDMYAMFAGCTKLTELDLRSFDLSNIQSTRFMFDGCSVLETIYCNADISELDGYSSEGMFRSCGKLVGGNGTECDGMIDVDATYARPDEEGKPGYFTSAKTGLESIQHSAGRGQKHLRDGILLIERGGKTYNALGAEIR